MISDYIIKVQEKVKELRTEHEKYFSSKLLLAFRGESSDFAETKLMLSLFRNADYVKKEVHLFELFGDYKIVEKSASNIEKAIEAQHYASISRMLDISFDMLVALYFACGNNNTDGNFFVFAFPEHYSPHSNYIENFYDKILQNEHIPYSHNFKVFSHSYVNERIKAQKGGFVFFPSNEYHKINQCYYRTVKIRQEDKEELLQELDSFFQINEASLFPEKDKIAKKVKEKFDDSNFYMRKVSLSDEVDAYVNRIQYELKLTKNELGEKELLRTLRKKEHDLFYYIDNSEKEDEIDNNERNKLKKKFEYIKLELEIGE